MSLLLTRIAQSLGPLGGGCEGRGGGSRSAGWRRPDFVDPDWSDAIETRRPIIGPCAMCSKIPYSGRITKTAKKVNLSAPRGHREARNRQALLDEAIPTT